jgi:hypothetical protein
MQMQTEIQIQMQMQTQIHATDSLCGVAVAEQRQPAGVTQIRLVLYSHSRASMYKYIRRLDDDDNDNDNPCRGERRDPLAATTQYKYSSRRRNRVHT